MKHLRDMSGLHYVLPLRGTVQPLPERHASTEVFVCDDVVEPRIGWCDFKQIRLLCEVLAKPQHLFQKWRTLLVAATWRLNDSYDDGIDDMIVRMYDQQRLEPK